MDQNGTNFSSGNSTLNSTSFSSEVFPGSDVVQLIILTVPTISLSIFTMVAIALAKKINWKIKTLLLNIFTAEVCFVFSLALRFLGFRIRLLINDDPASLVNLLCKITLATSITGGLGKVLSIALYSVATYFFIKTNINKIKWYAVTIPLIVSWVFSILFGLPSSFSQSTSIPRVFVYRGFCSFDLEEKDPDTTRIFIIIAVAWTIFASIGGVILTFAALTFRIRKNATDNKIKKAIARNLFYLTGGAFFTIINAVVLPTLTRFVTLEPDFSSDQEAIAQHVIISEFTINLCRSLSSLYIPVVTISMVKAVREAVKLC